MRQFPKVLIISKSLINDRDSAGASLRTWFKEWPKSHLAQLYSGIAVDSGAFCGCNFQVGSEERRFGQIFIRLKNSPLGDAAQPLRRCLRSTAAGPGKLWKKVIYRTGNFLIRSGLWELIFPPLLSPRLRKWIEEFSPEVLFIQSSGISSMRLSRLIHEAYGTPICFNIVDDWVEHLYKESFAAPLMQNVLGHTFRRLLEISSCRFTIGDLMAQEYRNRYGLSFTPLMHCGDSERFPLISNKQENGWRDIEVIYSGSLNSKRWRSLVHLAEASGQLANEGLKVKIIVYTPYVPLEAGSALEGLPTLTVRGALEDADVPGVMSAADILFLPESFDEAARSYTKLSVSTKAHLYMMSRRPILIYGPSEIGTVDYAKREGWGYVVDEEGVAPLVEALKLLINNRGLRESLVLKGDEVAKRNHEGRAIREHLRQSLLGLVKKESKSTDNAKNN